MKVLDCIKFIHAQRCVTCKQIDYKLKDVEPTMIEIAHKIFNSVTSQHYPLVRINACIRPVKE